MGKYSNVNANTLASAVSTALSELSNYDLSDVQKTLKSDKVIKSGAKEVVKNALGDIISSETKIGSVKVLKNKLKKLENAAKYIAKYQTAEDKIAELKKKLYKTEVSYKYSTDEDGNEVKTKVEKKVVDSSVQSQITTQENNIKSYESKIDEYLG